MNWIKVKDESPPFDTMILGLASNINLPIIVRKSRLSFHIPKYVVICMCEKEKCIDITHWMPLPELPE